MNSYFLALEIIKTHNFFETIKELENLGRKLECPCTTQSFKENSWYKSLL